MRAFNPRQRAGLADDGQTESCRSFSDQFVAQKTAVHEVGVHSLGIARPITEVGLTALPAIQLNRVKSTAMTTTFAWYEIPRSVSVAFHQALVEAGYDAELTLVDDSSHTGLTSSSQEAFDIAVDLALETARG